MCVQVSVITILFILQLKTLMTNYTFHIFTFFSPLSIIYRMSDIVTQRQRKPWFWPDTLYHLFGDGRIHDETLKVLHDFTFKVSVFKLDEKKKKTTHTY